MLVKKVIFILLAIFFIILGTIGIFLPLLPTVKFYLISTFFLINSSKKLHNKFINSNIYTKYLLDFKNNKRLKISHKIKIILSIWVSFIFLILFVNNQIMNISLIIIGTIKTFVIFFVIKTYKEK